MSERDEKRSTPAADADTANAERRDSARIPLNLLVREPALGGSSRRGRGTSPSAASSTGRCTRRSADGWR